MEYDFLIVGTGLFGSVFARKAADAGKRVVVIDRRQHIGGNVYSEVIEGIHVHKYGAHIFHTSDEEVWAFVNQYSEWNPFVNSPVADFNGEMFNLPFNMNTFYKLWGVITAQDARAAIESQRIQLDNPSNLEEQALSLAGRDIYEKLIKGYTEKQWGKPCSELPAFIIKRIPLKLTFDNNYFTDKYQAIPADGYAAFISKMQEGIEVRLNTPYEKGAIHAGKIIYTGAIDEYFDYCLGVLEYRSLRFENHVYDYDNVQANAVINYTSADVPYTRKIEHRHFDRNCKSAKSIVTTEYPETWQNGAERFYPVNDHKNNTLYAEYKELARIEKNVIFGGRLGNYQYFDMDKVIRTALDLFSSIP